MRKGCVYVVTLVVVLLMGGDWAEAQRYPERSMIRKGNRDYEKERYIDSEIDYRRALEKQPASSEAHFNLGNALYKQERFDEAAKQYEGLKGVELSPQAQAGVHYNMGNALLQERQIDQAIEEYKESLRINPNDQQAKFNLAYAKKLKDDNQQDQDQDKDNKDQDQKQDKDKDNKEQDPDKQPENDKENKDKEDKPDKGDGEQDKDKKDQQPPKPEKQPAEGGMNKKDAESLLDAMQMNEDKTQEKVDKKKAVESGSRLEKNW